MSHGYELACIKLAIAHLREALDMGCEFDVEDCVEIKKDVPKRQRQFFVWTGDSHFRVTLTTDGGLSAALVGPKVANELARAYGCDFSEEA